ncbi:T9SS type B sorting domain-containing protein, partial [Flavobacterium cerinum]
NNSAADYTIEFYFDQAALDAGTALPRLYTNVVPNSQTILVMVTNNATGCTITKPLQLIVEKAAIANPIVITKTPLFACDNDGVNDGFTDFDLTIVETEVLGAQNPNQYKVTYHLSEADADIESDMFPQGKNPITSPTTFINTIAPGQTIWVRVTNMSTVSKCHDITSFDIVVEQLPEPKIQGGTICIDKQTNEVLRTYEITTGLDATDHSFVWKKDGIVIAGETGASLIVDEPGIYSVIAKTTNDCASAEVSAEVLLSSPATKIGVGYYVSNAFSDNQTITVDVDGYGVYQYKLDEGPWQDSPVFNNVSPGEHSITVRDTKTDNPCEDLVIIGANIIDYPNFFTPNGDGFRDTWNIIGLNQPDAKIYIFDRYGKLLKQISAVGDGWDGTYNGENLPATDYWFTVTYKEIIGDISVTKEFKAHFSLLR